VPASAKMTQYNPLVATLAAVLNYHKLRGLGRTSIATLALTVMGDIYVPFKAYFPWLWYAIAAILLASVGVAFITRHDRGRNTGRRKPNLAFSCAADAALFSGVAAIVIPFFALVLPDPPGCSPPVNAEGCAMLAVGVQAMQTQLTLLQQSSEATQAIMRETAESVAEVGATAKTIETKTDRVLSKSDSANLQVVPVDSVSLLMGFDHPYRMRVRLPDDTKLPLMRCKLRLDKRYESSFLVNDRNCEEIVVKRLPQVFYDGSGPTTMLFSTLDVWSGNTLIRRFTPPEAVFLLDNAPPARWRFKQTEGGETFIAGTSLISVGRRFRFTAWRPTAHRCEWGPTNDPTLSIQPIAAGDNQCAAVLEVKSEFDPPEFKPSYFAPKRTPMPWRSKQVRLVIFDEASGLQYLSTGRTLVLR
jgi:hypothetical protein